MMMSELEGSMTLGPSRHGLGSRSTPARDGHPRSIAIAVGSFEQHGPHLPLDTDTRIAMAFAAGLAERRDDVMVGPVIAIGASGEHAGFPGTLSIGTEVLESVLVEVGRSADWATGLVFVNGHGGNLRSLRNAVATLTAEGRRATAWQPRIPGGDAHAGRTETSLMLAIAPESVRIDAAVAGRTEPLRELIDDLSVHGVAALSPTGVLGDPAGATADEGRSLLNALITDLVEHVDAWQR